MNISTKYDPSQVENKWYDYWLENKFFASKKDTSKEPFTIIIPPPNVTGMLHMGHILNNTIQDILIRKARMEGKNACWVPGTDHASIATEAKVVKMLREKGIKKSDIGREKFLEHAWEWKEKYGGIILKQLQRLGASCDWDREAFTMDKERSEQVIDMFIHLHEKGLIYRGLRMVNWDPEAKTVLSKEEVIYKDVNSKLYFTKYEIKDSEFEKPLYNYVIAFDAKGLVNEEGFGEQILSKIKNADLILTFEGHEKKFLDLEVETKTGEIKKVADLKITAHIQPTGLATNTILDIFMQNQVESLIIPVFRRKEEGNLEKKYIDFEKINIKDLQELKVSGKEYVTIATTRPETILGDTAICINPKDERYKHLHGKKAIVPMVNREVPIILDEYVDMEFGTGCLKVTPAHDENDYDLGKKHNLEVIEILNDDGTLNEKAQFFIGEDRFVVRKKIAKELKKLGNLIEVKDYQNQVGTSERTGAVIEPKLSEQWFVAMKDLCKPALENVMNDTIEFHPPSFKNMYKSWIDNIQDWNISRQLWWGHQIPAFYLPNGEIVVAKTKEQALKKANAKIGDITGWELAAERGNVSPEDVPKLYTESDLRQDEDVLDTWASSWLWPLSVFDKEELDYYYPTSVLVTGFDIIFFWVMRMIIAGYELKNEKPFKHVYFTGMVRDIYRRKMSKSLGNSPDVFKLMDIYSTDGLRYGILASSAAGNDIIFDTPVPGGNKSKAPTQEEIDKFNSNPKNLESKLCETGRNFANKIWNAFRLVKSWEVDENLENKNQAAIDWFKARFNQTLADIESKYQDFRLSEALVGLYKLIWDEFCSRYLEMIKPAYDQEAKKSLPIDKETLEITLQFFDDLMRILHPFMPFITEEVWQNLQKRKAKDSICIASYPKPENFDKQIINEAEQVFEVVQSINNIRNEKQLKKSLKLDLYFKAENKKLYQEKFISSIQKLAKVSKVQAWTLELDELKQATLASKNVMSFVTKDAEFFIPFEEEINVEEEKEKIEKELQRLKGFLKGVDKKLSNERFIKNAPEKVVAIEKQKKVDAEAKIKALEESLGSL